ncbi:MAG TPA: PDZ domain-containing protein, partial [Planctomycetaceae bacterium]|nr:PDZ domain-containing protein [Planctomycetaceae bacterium]
MNGLNLRRFEFDYDATWTAFFTDARLNVYSRYGGRDQGDPESRLSKSSLMHTMRQVLVLHDSVRAVRADAASAIPVFQPVPDEVARPEDMPLLKKSHQGCVHCHQVREYSLLQAYHDGRFHRELLFPFPLPESLGIEMDRQHGHRAAKIQPASPAAASGLQAGDEIVLISDVPIRSELDFRWALHRLPLGTSHVTVQASRPQPALSSSGDAPPARLVTIDLSLPPHWRESELNWRKSSRSVPVDWGFRAAPLTGSQRRESNLPNDGLAIRVLSVKPRGLSAAINLMKDDVITALDGEHRARTL